MLKNRELDLVVLSQSDVTSEMELSRWAWKIFC